MADAALTLIVSSQCPLCDVARRTVVEVAAEFGESVTERRVEDDVLLRERFAEEVPVLMIDGVPRDFWSIDPVRLRRLLTERAARRAG